MTRTYQSIVAYCEDIAPIFLWLHAYTAVSDLIEKSDHVRLFNGEQKDIFSDQS